MSEGPDKCSFCGKNQHQVARLFAGPRGVAICSECVALCNQILAQDTSTPEPPTPSPSGGGWQKFLGRS